MKIKEFFWPDWRTILVFLFFSFIAFVGYTQTWAFSKEIAPKPFFYDIFILEPFLFLGTLWVILLLPLILLSEFLVLVGGYDADFIMRGPYWFFVLANIIYFYFLSCLVIFIYDKIKIRIKKQKKK